MELKDVIHFYLGCEIQFRDKSVGKLTAVLNTHNGTWVSTIDYGLPKSEWHHSDIIKLILRPLSDMTEEEKKEVKKISSVSQGINLLPEIPAGRLLNIYHPSCAPQMIKYLLSRGFDIFNLHQHQLCIFKSEIK